MAAMTKMTRTECTTIYHATLNLDPSGNWLAELVEIPQVHTFGRTLGKAKEHLYDALALWLDVPVAQVFGCVEFAMPELPGEVIEAVRVAVGARELADAAQKVATEAGTAASVALVGDMHLSMRDAAEILGVSHQRIHQLVTSSPSATWPQLRTRLEDVFKANMQAQHAPAMAFDQLLKEDTKTLVAALLIGAAAMALISRSS
jgi:predicted RNase H-like HicB family nuclease/plasmid maintenance system antidote protein VapI